MDKTNGVTVKAKITQANAQSLVVASYPNAYSDKTRKSRTARATWWICGGGSLCLGEGSSQKAAWLDAAVKLAASEDAS